MTRHVQDGGPLVTRYFSGIVDEDHHVWPGGYPGALRPLLGIVWRVRALLDDAAVELDNGVVGTGVDGKD
jgi:beta-galactosidase